MNADERRFIELVASLCNHIISPYALCAACPHAARLGVVRRGGGGMDGRGGGSEVVEGHINHHIIILLSSFVMNPVSKL